MSHVGRKPLDNRQTEVVAKLKEAFKLRATVSEACQHAGISRQTYYNIVNGDDDLADEFKALKTAPVLTAKRTVDKKIKGGDANLGLKYLDHVERSRANKSGKIDPDSLKVWQSLDKLTQSEREQIRLASWSGSEYLLAKVGLGIIDYKRYGMTKEQAERLYRLTKDRELGEPVDKRLKDIKALTQYRGLTPF